MKNVGVLLLVIALGALGGAQSGLQCSVKPSCIGGEISVLRIYGTSPLPIENTHAEIPTNSTAGYSNICCNGAGLMNDFSCGGERSTPFIALSSQTNAHGEYPIGSYPYPLCLNADTEIDCDLLDPTVRTPSTQSCIVELNDFTNAHFYECDTVDTDGLYKLVCGPPEPARSGDIIEVEITRLEQQSAETRVFTRGNTTANAIITVRNKSTHDFPASHIRLDYNLLSVTGQEIDSESTLIVNPLGPRSSITNTYNFGVPAVAANAQPGGYIIRASVPPYVDAANGVRETFVSNNSDEEFITIVNAGQAANVPETSVLFVPIIALIVLGLIKTQKKDSFK